MTTLQEPTVLDELSEGELLSLPENEAELVAFADRMLNDLKDCRDERAANEAARKLRVEQINLRYTDLDLPLERREARLLAYLEQMARGLTTEKKRSRHLAYGTLKFIAHGAKLKVLDAAVAEEWAKQQPMDIAASLIRTKKVTSLDKAALDTYCLTEGLIPKGCELVPAGDSFYATISDEPHA